MREARREARRPTSATKAKALPALSSSPATAAAAAPATPGVPAASVAPGATSRTVPAVQFQTGHTGLSERRLAGHPRHVLHWDTSVQDHCIDDRRGQYLFVANGVRATTAPSSPATTAPAAWRAPAGPSASATASHAPPQLSSSPAQAARAAPGATAALATTPPLTDPAPAARTTPAATRVYYPRLAPGQYLGVTQENSKGVWTWGEALHQGDSELKQVTMPVRGGVTTPTRKWSFHDAYCGIGGLSRGMQLSLIHI